MDRLLLSETAATVTLQCIKHSFEANRVLTTKNYTVQLLSVKTLRGTKRKFESRNYLNLHMSARETDAGCSFLALSWMQFFSSYSFDSQEFRSM